jgi:hypothetical protein
MVASAARWIGAERVGNVAVGIAHVIEARPGGVGQSCDLDDTTEA